MKLKFQYFQPPDAKSQLIRKDPDSGKDRTHEEKGMAENEMVGWHHQLDRHEFEQAPGDGEGQRSLVCCSSCKQLDTTEQLNNNNKGGKISVLRNKYKILLKEIRDDQ